MPISPDTVALVIESLRAGVDLPRSLKSARVTAAAWADALAADPALAAEVQAALEAAAAETERARKEAWAAMVADSAAREAEERARVKQKEQATRKTARGTVAANDTAEPDRTEEGWHTVRAEAAKIWPHEAPHFRMLLWLSMRRELAGMHALDPIWLALIRDFYVSCKPLMVARKGLRAGGSVTAICALLNDALDTIRDLDPGTIGVFPIMSSSRDEANDRFFTAKLVLRAMGIAPKKGDDEEMLQVLPNGIGGTYHSTKSQSGGGIIALRDSQGHELELRILPAMRRSAVGFTSPGFFLDETDMWPADAEIHRNPADLVIEDILKRITTQPTARGYIFSASYYAESAHSRRVDMGDTSAQFLARLGETGARDDEDMRRAFAAKIGSTDPRLLAPGDPMSPDLPAWVLNRAKSPIERCYQLADDNLGKMLALYGGRAAENAAAGSALAGVVIGESAEPQRGTLSDVVIGVAPPLEGEQAWGIVAVGIGDDGYIAISDSSVTVRGADSPAGLLAILGTAHGASVIACAREHAPRLRAEIAAALSGLGSYAPPVTDADVSDAGTLRTGPLRSLYDASRLRHVAGLTGLTKAVRGYRPGARSLRVEALAAAVTRLVACYPWAGEGTGERLRGPAPVGTMTEPSRGRAVAYGGSQV